MFVRFRFLSFDRCVPDCFALQVQFLCQLAPARTDPSALLGRAGSDRGATRAGAGLLFAQKRRGARFQGSSEGQTRTFPSGFLAQITRSVRRSSFGNLVKCLARRLLKAKPQPAAPLRGAPPGNGPVEPRRAARASFR